jgi:hypothetical protein
LNCAGTTAKAADARAIARKNLITRSNGISDKRANFAHARGKSK